jgi:ATP-dependent DNA ligase
MLDNVYFMGCGGKKKSDDLIKAEKSGIFVAEPKKDGIWCAVVSNDNGQFFFSRNGLPKEVKLPILPKGTILCGELGYGSAESTEMRKKLGHDYMDIFDVISYGGVKVAHLPDNHRRKALETIQNKNIWKNYQEHFRIVPRWFDDFLTRYEAEPEGLVLKRIDIEGSPYKIGTCNPHWYTVKKHITVDVVITGYTLSDASSFNGLKYARNLICGVYKNGKLIDTIQVSVQKHHLKADIIANWEKYKCKVIELKTYKVFKSGRLRHPSIVKIREDKNPEECTWNSLMAYV